ncbi:MAG: radical SAM protein [Methanobrevibacter sp.]|jgi:radical SAM protein with 4Fe4S-binding SPASM domain|nr:radical SAM protein [Methanobrevibacter sp.]
MKRKDFMKEKDSMNNNYPYVKEDFYFRPGPMPYIYSKKDNQYYQLNKDGSDIVIRCNGKENIDKISNNLASIYNEDLTEINRTIIDYISSQEFIGISNKRKPVDDKYWINPDIQTPVHLSIELTDHCNYICRHCYRNSDTKNDNYIKTDELLDILSEFRRNGVAIVELTGGEPLSHPDFEKILKFSLEAFDVVAVITNGSLISEEFLDRVLKYKNKLVFQIGLYSNDKEYMDWFCGYEGAFKRSKKIIKQITNRGFHLRVVMMVTPFNVNNIFSTVELASSLGIPFKPVEYNYNLGMYTIGISPVTPMGRGEKFPELIFKQEDIDIFLKEMEKVRIEFGDFIFKMPEHHPIYDLSKRGNCGVGSRSLTITPKGDIKLCGMSDEKILSWGNVYKEKLSDIFAKNLGATLANIPAPDKKNCGDCEHLMFCMPCLAKAFLKYSELGEKCFWGNNLNLNDFLEINSN